MYKFQFLKEHHSGTILHSSLHWEKFPFPFHFSKTSENFLNKFGHKRSYEYQFPLLGHFSTIQYKCQRFHLNVPLISTSHAHTLSHWPILLNSTLHFSRKTILCHAFYCSRKIRHIFQLLWSEHHKMDDYEQTLLKTKKSWLSKPLFPIEVDDHFKYFECSFQNKLVYQGWTEFWSSVYWQCRLFLVSKGNSFW